jgi:hypothetical protein
MDRRYFFYGPILVIVILAAVLMLLPNPKSIKKEYEWYQKNEFSTLIQKYTEYLETLSPMQTINDTELTQIQLREKALSLRENDLPFKVRWCQELKILYITRPGETWAVVNVYYCRF